MTENLDQETFKKPSKIFVIGFNKTGTTSINRLLQLENIKSIHTLTPVLKIINKYDAFTDGNHLNFKEYYKRFPDSVFILNTRSIYSWILSRYKHAKKHNFKHCWCWPISDKKTSGWINERETHYKKILNFFSDKPHQLLIVNIEKEGWEKVIIKFVKNKNTKVRLKLNTRDNHTVKNHMIDIINHTKEFLKKNNYTGDELLCKEPLNVEKYTSYL